jgi:hypothetical protein
MSWILTVNVAGMDEIAMDLCQYLPVADAATGTKQKTMVYGDQRMTSTANSILDHPESLVVW